MTVNIFRLFTVRKQRHNLPEFKSEKRCNPTFVNVYFHLT